MQISDFGLAMIVTLMWLSGFGCGWQAGRGPKEWRRVMKALAQHRRHLRHRLRAPAPPTTED